jgi:hypothetical protein
MRKSGLGFDATREPTVDLPSDGDSSRRARAAYRATVRIEPKPRRLAAVCGAAGTGLARKRIYVP